MCRQFLIGCEWYEERYDLGHHILYFEGFSVPKLNSNECDKPPKIIYSQRNNEQCTNKSSQ